MSKIETYTTSEMMIKPEYHFRKSGESYCSSKEYYGIDIRTGELIRNVVVEDEWVNDWIQRETMVNLTSELMTAEWYVYDTSKPELLSLNSDQFYMIFGELWDINQTRRINNRVFKLISHDENNINLQLM